MRLLRSATQRVKSPGRYDRSITQTSPGLFSASFVLQPHTRFPGWTPGACSRGASGTGCSRAPRGTPAAHFAAPRQQKARSILQPERSPLLAPLVWPRRHFLHAKRKVSKAFTVSLQRFQLLILPLHWTASAQNAFSQSIWILHFEWSDFSHQKHFVHPQNVTFPWVWKE